MERNPNPNRSMRDYRNQWMSAPFCSAPPTNAPPTSPYCASTPQPPQPPQLTSPVEQAILNLIKLVGDVVEKQKTFNAQLRQRIHIVENSLSQKLDGLQSGIAQHLTTCKVELIINLTTYRNQFQGLPNNMFIQRKKIQRESA